MTDKKTIPSKTSPALPATNKGSCCGGQPMDIAVLEAVAVMPDAHPDAITGAPDSHPLGTGIGAAGAGLAGAAIGAALGPPGSIVGGVIGVVAGAIAGGLAGKGVAEAVDPTAEEAYWRDSFTDRPYYVPGSTYDDYAYDYAYGYDAPVRFGHRPYAEIESDLRRDWEKTQTRKANGSKLWEKSQHAVRDAYERVADRKRATASHHGQSVSSFAATH
jgi:hypothetical protein